MLTSEAKWDPVSRVGRNKWEEMVERLSEDWTAQRKLCTNCVDRSEQKSLAETIQGRTHIEILPEYMRERVDNVVEQL